MNNLSILFVIRLFLTLEQRLNEQQYRQHGKDVMVVPQLLEKVER